MSKISLNDAADILADDEELAAKIGAEIARVFKLRRDTENNDRWETEWGTKTNAGVARSMVRLISDS